VFKVIDLTAEGKLEASEDLARVAPPGPGARRWIDVVSPTPDELRLLRERFDFHPLAIEDCGRFELRSKIEEYRSHLFIVLHAFTAAPEDPEDLQIHEIHAFVGEGYLVTVHDRAVPAVEAIRSEAATDPAVLGRGPAWVLYRAADAMVAATFPLLDLLVQRVEEIESAVLESPDPRGLRAIFGLRSTLVTIKRVLRPLRDVVAIMTRRSEAPLDGRTALYFRDIQDQVQRSVETVEETEGLIANVIDAYRYELSTRSNQIMARLTLFSAIFLPLGFITGFWGQNFGHLPYGSDGFLASMLIAIGVVPIALLVYFWKKGWMR
jgi:magnesium transporter